MAQGLREFVDKYGSEPKQPSMNEFVNQYGTNKKQGGKPSQQQTQPAQQKAQPAQQPTVYEQRKERQNQAAENAKKAWWDVLGFAAQDATAAAMGQPKMLTAEEGRQRANAGANLNAAIKENREANKVNEWDGRKELLKEYRRLDKIDNPKARQQAQEIREQLRQGDVKAGNLAEGGDMAYNFGDWTGRIVPGGVKNAAAGGYNALLTALDMYAKAQAMQGPTEDELIQEWLTGQEPGSIQKQRQAGYESPEFRQFMNERYAEASAIKASAQRDLQIAKENQRPVVKAGVDIGENIIEMGADAAIAHLTGGSSLIPMAVRVFGSGAMDAREQGYSLEQQAAYGAAQAAIEVFTEKIGGIGGRGKGWSDALADKLVDELAQTTMGKNALRFLIAMAEEGGEEVLSDFMQPLANYAAGMKWDGYNAEEMLYDFFIGSVVGGMSSVKSMTLGSGNAAPQTAQEAAGAPQAAQGAEIAPTGTETPTAAPVELNSAPAIAEAEATPETAPEAAPEAAPPVVETPTEAASEAPAAVAEAPAAEAPAPAQPAVKKTTATEATRKLQEKYGDGLRTQETRGKIQSLARQAGETDFSDPAQVRSLWESAKQQAREILNTTEDPSARTGGDTGGEIRSYLRGQKIRIDERLRNDRPSEYESLLELRRKTFGTLNFSNTEGMTLDEVYKELGTMFGEGLFPQDTMSHSEIVERILNAVANEKGQGYTYEQSLSAAEYERAAADLAMDLMRAAEGVTGTTIPTPVREAQQSLTLEQEREAAIESELDADFEGDLTREDAERIVDERYEAYGEYDLDKILNGLEDSYGETGEEADDFDEYAYYAERYRAADAENADEAADAGGTEELPETVGQGTPERGLAAYEPAGAGEVRGPGSLAPDGEVSDGEGAAESGPEPGQKRSKTESHTLQNMAERLGGEQDELYYTPKSERESLANAINRVDADMGGEMQKLLDKEMWNGEDIDTALTIQGMLQLDGVRNGDFSAAQAWARAIQARGTESGRALQAFSKWTRSGAAAAAQSVETLLEAENLTEEDRTRISNDVYQFGRDYDSIEDGDLDGIRDLIKRQARYRNTWTFGKKGFERMLNEVTDFEWLKEYAMRQLMNIPGDYTQKADIGQQVKTWQVLAQLSRLGTFFRNIGGNGVFGIQDTLSQDFFGVALDAMLGKITGKRTLGLDKGWLSSEARKGARQGLVRSVLEVAGDVDMGGSGNRYDQTVNRTFKMTGGALSRVLSRWEQLQGYSLTTSDRTFRGGIEAEQQRGLSGFENLTEEERQALAQNMADYRLFQNHGTAYSLSKGLHDLFNLAGVGGEVNKVGPFKFRQGGFGVADLANPYPGVPANLGVKALEYSPLNVAKGLTDMAKLLSDAKTGGKIDVTKQQNAVMDIARGLHGTALLAGLAALFKAGLFKNADDEEDKDAKALANAEGRQGVQMNLSAILRYLQGGSAEWKDGDQLMKIDWLEPMNAFLAIASMAADENDLPGYVGATFDGTLQSILDMPVMESFSNIFDNYNYSKGETVREKLGDVAVGFGADALTGMLPAPVSQTARAMDPYYRETIGESASDTALRRVMNAIPGLRQQLDPKLDNFGRPKEQASSAYNRWMNSFVRPGQISDYKLGDVEQALDEFAQRTGEAVYPDRKAPNSFSAGGEKIQLSGEEKQAYQETYGQAALQYYGEILLGDEYRDASDGEKQWLLDQAEAYAAYQAKKAIMEQRGETYSNSSWDKVDALEQRGGDPFDYLFAKQSMKTATDAKDYKAVDALLGDIDKMDKATQEQLYDDVPSLDDRVEAHKAGIDTVLWEAAYAKKKKLAEDKSTSATQDVISMTQYLDSQKNLNRKQKDLLREQMGFYTTFRADAEKFDKLTGAGLSADKAGKVWNAINALQPMEGHAGVTQNQRIRAISSMGNLSEAEKWAVLEFYSSDSCYEKAMAAKAKGKSFDQWVKEYTKGK